MARSIRNLFLRVNRFQLSIILCITSLGLACLVLMILFLSYLYADANNFIHTFPFATIKICILVAFPITAILILIVCIYAYYMTNKMFGPYERVVKELRDIEQTGQKRELHVRGGDDMFQDLIDQINALIRRIP